MSNKKLGLEPAYPIVSDQGAVTTNPEFATGYGSGMSKRFYAACCAMQGLLSNSTYEPLKVSTFIADAYRYADELLKQENP